MSTSSGRFNEFANSLSFYNSGKGSQTRLSDNVTMVSLGPSAPTSNTSTTYGASNSSSLFPLFLGNITVNKPNSTAGDYNKSSTSYSAAAAPGDLDGLLRYRDEEEGGGGLMGFAQKGLNVAKAGATALAGGAKTVVNNAHQSLNDSPVSLSPQRLMYFGVALAAGCMFMMLAFLLLPTIVFAPSKFALLFTMGSGSFMVSLGLLKGFAPFVAHLISWQRLPFTFTYGASLLLTLYATLVAKSYVLTLLFSIVQIGALISFLVSYIPGGTSALKFIGGTAWKMAKGACKCNDSRESSLPI